MSNIATYRSVSIIIAYLEHIVKLQITISWLGIRFLCDKLTRNQEIYDNEMI
jgi:hypothetical protein